MTRSEVIRKMRSEKKISGGMSVLRFERFLEGLWKDIVKFASVII